jgi:hypothetical protein
MGSIVHSLRIRTLKKQIAALRKRCNALAVQFEATESHPEKAKIKQAHDRVLRRTHERQLMLETLERSQSRTR